MTNMDFLSISNNFFKKGHEQQLNHDELYLYFHLHTRRNYDTKTAITNIYLIEKEVNFVKKSQDNRQRIFRAIYSLREKKLITFHGNISMDNLVNISVNDIHDSKMGYQRIPYSIFHLTCDPVEFMILAYIEKVKGYKRDICFKEFESILLNEKGSYVTDRTIKKKIKLMEDKGVLIIEHGEYYITEDNNKRKTINQYTVNDKLEDQPVADMSIKKVKKSRSIANLMVETKESRKHNLFDYVSKLNENDMYVYLTTDCEILKEFARERYERIASTDNGKQLYENWLKKAETKIKREEQSRIREGKIDNDYVEFMTSKINYKPKGGINNIVEFLD